MFISPRWGGEPRSRPGLDNRPLGCSVMNTSARLPVIVHGSIIVQLNSDVQVLHLVSMMKIFDRSFWTGNRRCDNENN